MGTNANNAASDDDAAHKGMRPSRCRCVWVILPLALLLAATWAAVSSWLIKSVPKPKTQVQALLEYWRAPNPGWVRSQLQSIGLADRPVSRDAGEVLNEILAFGSKAIPDLVEALQHEDVFVRRNALFALGHLRDPSTIPVMVDCLCNEDWGVRDGVPYALSQIEALPSQALERLRQALTHEHPHVRRIAAQTLANVNPVETASVLALVKSAQDPDQDVRSQVVVSLGAIGAGRPEACQALRAALQDGDPQVRLNAVDGLIKIDTANRPETIHAVLQALRELLRCSEATIRSRACSELYGIGQNAAPLVPVLIDCLRDQDEDVRCSACFTLGALGAAANPALDQLRRLASQDPSRRVRERAAFAIKLNEHTWSE
ncbi:MAG: putative lyase [Planctomycetes bacterium ADurb.Bin126]|nr:MAG: putative lyase [Planctomycetes bacterium ADurb.Bin126]HOD83359.1 HEAT repeat domain-containing protein [Phycisphaerae bacterium]HQL76101.1 HEAT repeat domain-containing protein [Phycisphaerae bacterium]